MYKYLCLNPIASVGLSRLPEGYQKIEEGEPDAYLVRSANMKEMDIPASTLAVARAGAGVNNIPLDVCADKGIVVFNTPGANANGVKELVIAGMLLAARDVVGGINWLKSQEPTPDLQKAAEKQKKQYAGTEILGKTLGIIGLGAIGALVANAAIGLGMNVVGYDAFLSPKAALSLDPKVKVVTKLDDLYAVSDYITIHVPLNDATKGMIGEEAISKMKDGVIVLNFARDPLADEAAVIAALESGKMRKYVTDFVTPGIMSQKNALALPHLGASTEEAEDNCAIMAAEELTAYLECGTIRNSVNYPALDAGCPKTEGRVTVCYKASDEMAAKLSAAAGASLAGIMTAVRGGYGYAVVDLNASGASIVDAVSAIDGVIRARVIK